MALRRQSAVRRSRWLGLFVELFERLATFCFPRGKSVCAPAVYDSRRRWTGKLRILGEDQEAALVDKRAIGDELFALGYDVGIDLGGWAFLQDGGGTLEYDEAIRRTLAPRLGAPCCGEEYARRSAASRGCPGRKSRAGIAESLYVTPYWLLACLFAGVSALPSCLRCWVSIFLMLSTTGNSSGIVPPNSRMVCRTFAPTSRCVRFAASFTLYLVPAQLLLRLGRAKQVRRQFRAAPVIQNLLALFQAFPPVNVSLFQPTIKPHISVILKDGVVYGFDNAGALGRVGQLNVMTSDLFTQQNPPLILDAPVCQFLPPRLDRKVGLTMRHNLLFRIGVLNDEVAGIARKQCDVDLTPATLSDLDHFADVSKMILNHDARC